MCFLQPHVLTFALLKQIKGENMIDKLIEHFGSRKALYEALGVTRQCLSQYEKRGYLPAKRAIEIEAITKGKFKAKDIC